MTERENRPPISVRVKCGQEPDVAIPVHPQYGNDPAIVHMLLHLALFCCERPLVMDEHVRILEFPPDVVTALLVSRADDDLRD
jgi:hypothetical protein